MAIEINLLDLANSEHGTTRVTRRNTEELYNRAFMIWTYEQLRYLTCSNDIKYNFSKNAVLYKDLKLCERNIFKNDSVF